MDSDDTSRKQPNRVPYRGKFTFDENTLERCIREWRPDYDKKDPATWPYITLWNIDRHCGKYDGTVSLPRYVVYESRVMELFVAKHPLSYHKSYPYNFAPDGSLRYPEYMTVKEYTEYCHDNNGTHTAEENWQKLSSKGMCYNSDRPTTHIATESLSDNRRTLLLAQKFEDNNNELTSLRRKLGLREAALNDAKADFTRTKGLVEAAERRCELLEQRVKSAEEQRDSRQEWVNRLEERFAELIKENKQLRMGESGTKTSSR